MKLSAPLLLAALASMFSTTTALPVERLEARDVFVPPILYPHAGTVWKMGERHNVTWSLEYEPVNITNSIGFIVLAKDGLMSSVGTGSLDDPVASNFSIRLGRVEITVPYVPPADDYQLVLFGDSGNFGPKFTIELPCA